MPGEGLFAARYALYRGEDPSAGLALVDTSLAAALALNPSHAGALLLFDACRADDRVRGDELRGRAEELLAAAIAKRPALGRDYDRLLAEARAGSLASRRL